MGNTTISISDDKGWTSISRDMTTVHDYIIAMMTICMCMGFSHETILEGMAELVHSDTPYRKKRWVPE